MKVGAPLLVAALAIACDSSPSSRATAAETPAEAAQQAGAIKTSTDPSVNPDATVMAEFKARVEKYAELLGAYVFLLFRGSPGEVLVLTRRSTTRV